jgi:hypothetical protein
MRIDAVDAASTIGAIGDEAGLLEQFQMLGDGGSADRHTLGDAADRQRTAGETFDDAPSCWVAKNIQSVLRVSYC